jgi:phosphatidylglycerophosphate synthase
MLKSTKTAAKASELIGKLLGWLPLDPNSITITSIFVAFFGFLAAFEGGLAGNAMALVLFAIAFFLDAVDGAIARAKNLVSKEGGFIDGIADRMVEFFLILSILQFFRFDEYPQIATIAILFFGTCMTSFVKAYAEHQGVMSHEKAKKLPGLLERAERSILLLAIFVLLIAGFRQYAIYGVYLTAALSLITFVQRFFTALYGKRD